MKSLYIFGAVNIVGWILAFMGLFILHAIIRYKVFTKAGVAGWKSFVPIYGDYTEYQIAWSTKWFWINLIASCCCSMLMFIPVIGPIIIAASMCVAYFINVFFNLQLAKAFGKSEGFGIGLIVCGPIFRFLLAFDKDIKYIGPQDDPAIFNSAKNEVSNIFVEPKNEEENTTTDTNTEYLDEDDDDDTDFSDVHIEKL